MMYLLLLQLLLLRLHYIHCQAGKHIKKKGSARRTHGRGVEASSKLSSSKGLITSEVKMLSVCKVDVCMNVCIYMLLFPSLVGIS